IQQGNRYTPPHLQPPLPHHSPTPPPLHPPPPLPQPPSTPPHTQLPRPSSPVSVPSQHIPPHSATKTTIPLPSAQPAQSVQYDEHNHPSWQGDRTGLFYRRAKDPGHGTQRPLRGGRICLFER